MCRYILSSKCAVFLLFFYTNLKYNYANSDRPGQSDVCFWKKPCRNLGRCENTENGFKCKCYEQFYEESSECSCTPGKKLCIKSYCQSNPCQNGGTCVDVWGSFFCKCTQGFQGQSCETNADGNLNRMDVPTLLYDLDVETLKQLNILFFLKSPNLGDNFKLVIKVDNNFMEITKLYLANIDFFMKHLRSEHLKKYMKGIGSTYMYTFKGHFFQKFEEIPIELEVYNNGVIQFSNKYFVNVMPNPYKCTPKVTLKGCRRFMGNPSIWNRREEYEVRSLVERDCREFHSSLTYNWMLSKTSQYGYETFSIENPASTFFINGAFTLSYGFYTLTLNVSETIDDESLVSSYYNMHECYFIMSPLPVVAKILGGDLIFASNKEDLVVSAASSYNPNYYDGKNHLKYEWTCLTSTNSKICTNDRFKDHVFINKEHLTLGIEITFSVTVSDNDFSFTAKDMQKVKIVSGTSPKLSIICVSNCGDIMLPNPARTIAMKVECLEKCTGSNIIYEWDIIGDPPTGWIDKAPFGRNSIDFYIKGNTLKPGQAYSFQIKGGNANYKTIEQLKMTMGKNPTSGTCNIKPEKGISRKTIFEATCQNFKSFVQYEDLHYEFYQCDNTNTLGRLIEYGTEPKALFFLTTADKNSICVKVTDNYGMSVMQVLNVQVEPLKNITTKDIKDPESLLSLNYAVKLGDPSVFTAHMLFLMEIAPNFEEEVTLYIKRKVLEMFSKIPLSSINSITLTASSIIKLLNKDLSPIKIEDSGAISPALRRVSKKFVEIVTAYMENGYITEHLMQISMILLKSASHILAHNPPFKPDDKIEMDYPVYSELYPKVVREKVNMEIATYDTFYIIRQVGKALNSYFVPTDTAVKYESQEFKMWFMVTKSYNIKDFLKEIDTRENTIDISEALSNFFGELKPHLGPQLTVFKGNRFWWYQTGNTTNTPVISFDIHYFAAKLQLPTPLDIFFTINESESDYSVSGEIDMSVNWKDADEFDQSIALHQIRANKGDMLSVLFESFQNNKKYKVISTNNKRPSLEDVAGNSKIIPSDEEPKLWYTSNEIVKEDETFVYLGLIPVDEMSSGIVKYTMKVFIIKCQYWDENLLEWSSEGCYLGKRSTSKNIHCKCDHLSVFSGLRAVPPNKIDFLKVFSMSLNMADNPYILVLIMCLFLLFLILFIFGYIQDKKDQIRREVVFINDNIPGYSYVYLIGVFTGNKWNAKTTSNVGIQLVGDKYKSRTHILNGKRKLLFERNSDNWFILLARTNLGKINYLRLWHDNTGSSPSWYCDRIIVRDIQKNSEWIFLVQEWLSLSKGSGYVYYIISETPPEVLKSFDVLFPANTLQLVEREHPWLRVYMRHPRSPSSRCRRIILLFSNILISMLISLSFFGIPKGSPEDTIELGGLGISKTEIIISIETAFATMPVIFILTIMFKKTVPREVYDFHIVKGDTTGFVEGNDFDQNASHNGNGLVGKAELVTAAEPLHSKENGLSSTIVNLINYVEEEPFYFSPNINVSDHSKVSHGASSKPNEISQMKVYKIEKPVSEEIQIKGLDKILYQYWFPAWFIYVAWLFAVCICLVCASLIIMYGFSYGKVKSYSWVVTTLGSNCISSLVITPIKIILLATLLSWILKKQPNIMEISGTIYINTDKFYPQEPRSVTLYLLKLNLKRQRKMYRPLSEEEAKHIRIMEYKKAAYLETFHSFVIFIVYMIMLYCVIIGIRDSVAYYKSITIKSILMKGMKSHSIENITDTQQWIDFYNDTVIPALYEVSLYNKKPLTQAGWAYDINTFLVGVARLRQIRVMKDTCEYPINLNDSIRKCSPEYSWKVADDQSYYLEWTTRKTRALISSQANMPWIYQTATETGSWNLYGAINTYGGEGYISNLGRTRVNSIIILNFLDEFKWFDVYARSVIVEYTTFNPNRNLFSLDSIIVEKSATGAIFSTIQSYTIMLLPGGDVWGIILQVIPVVFLFVLLVMLWLLFLKLQKMGILKYFRHPWNCIDIIIVCLGMSSVGLCFVRHSDIIKLIEDLQTSERNEFLSFHSACLFDRILVYLLSVLLCLSTARLWKTLDVFENFHLFNVTFKSATFLLTMMVALLIVSLFLFAILSHIFLSTVAHSYSSLFDSLCSVLAATFKYGTQLDYRLFMQRNFTIGYLAYLLYGFTIKIFVLNLIIVTILIYYRNVNYMLSHTARKENFYNYIKQIMVNYVRKPKKRLRAGSDLKPLATVIHHSRSPLIISKRNRNLKVSEEKLQKVKLALMQQLATNILKKVTLPNRIGCLSAIVINEFENSYDRQKVPRHTKEYEYFYRGVLDDSHKLIHKERVLDIKVVVESEISKLCTLDEETKNLIEKIPREDEFIIKNGIWNSKYDSVLEDLFCAEIEKPVSQSQQPKNVRKTPHELARGRVGHLQEVKGSSGSEMKEMPYVSKEVSWHHPKEPQKYYGHAVRGSKGHEPKGEAEVAKGISWPDQAEKLNKASSTQEPYQKEEAVAKLCCLHLPDFKLVIESSSIKENMAFCCIERPKSITNSKTIEYLFYRRVPDSQTAHHQYYLFHEYFQQALPNMRNEEEGEDIMTMILLDSSNQHMHFNIELVNASDRQGFKITVVKETESQVKLFIKRL